jgi:hypothetical protein
MNINKISAIKFLLPAILLGFILFPYCASAQSLSLTSDKSTCNVGDDILVVLNLDTSDKSINVVDGTVTFPTEFFDIQSIRTGDSFLTLWQERPTASAGGKIVFTGGVPNGFIGQTGNVFSFVLRAKKVGEASISVNNATVLLNDGLGTELNGVVFTPAKVIITAPAEKTPGQTVPGENINEQQQPVVDKISPLPFTPVLARNPSIAGNKFFVSFSTVDKETGISYYKIREEYVLLPYFGPLFFSDWQKAETPYILKLQHWWSKIYIRAYDNAGNFREEIVTKPLDDEGIIILKIIISATAIIIVLILFFFIKRILKQNKK